MKNKAYLIGLKHRKINELFPLRRFVRCSRCNEYMTGSRPTKGTTKLLRELLKCQVRHGLGGINQDLSRIRDALDANDAYKQKILNKFINDKISESDKKVAMREADANRLVLELEPDKVKRKQNISETSIDHALNFMANISTHWHDAPLELRQMYQDLVFPNGFAYYIKGHNFITPDISPLYRLELGPSGL